MTDYDQREELYAALGRKMMGSGVTGNSSRSNREVSGSLPDSPAKENDAMKKPIYVDDATGA